MGNMLGPDGFRRLAVALERLTGMKALMLVSRKNHRYRRDVV
jgi:hypothetical protein